MGGHHSGLPDILIRRPLPRTAFPSVDTLRLGRRSSSSSVEGRRVAIYHSSSLIGSVSLIFTGAGPSPCSAVRNWSISGAVSSSSTSRHARHPVAGGLRNQPARGRRRLCRAAGGARPRAGPRRGSARLLAASGQGLAAREFPGLFLLLGKREAGGAQIPQSRPKARVSAKKKPGRTQAAGLVTPSGAARQAATGSSASFSPAFILSGVA